MESIPQKTCTKCKQSKPLDMFSPAKKGLHGRQSYCKPCMVLAQADYARRNPEKMRDKGRRRYSRHKDQINAERQAKRKNDGDALRERARERYWQDRERKAEERRQYNAENRERLNQARRMSYWRDPDRTRAASRSRYARNHEHIIRQSKIATKNWRARNRAAYNAKEHRYRAHKRGNGGTYTAQQWTELIERYGHQCLKCLRREPEIKLTVDHVIPVSLGGSNDISNIQPLCLSCNTSKRNRNTTDYRLLH